MSTITATPRTAAGRGPSARKTSPSSSPLGRYTESEAGAVREIARLSLPDGSALLIDRLSGTQGDARLLARLEADEPHENAQILCAMYLADESRSRCRPVTGADFDAAPIAEPPGVHIEHELREATGAAYRIQPMASNGRRPELRWTRCVPPSRPETVHLRDLVAQVENYEPRTITAAALAGHRADPTLSTTCLAAELARLTESPIVLNRALREAVQARIARGESMSEIAIRCGRVKRDRRGNVSGETSWLARRIGQLPEGGQDRPTPWIHSDTLALIARQGLDVAPYEVEL